jgi:hypothetical protein
MTLTVAQRADGGGEMRPAGDDNDDQAMAVEHEQADRRVEALQFHAWT